MIKTFLLMPFIVFSLASSQVWAQYSWGQPHAKVLPTGDLQWAPKPYVYTPGQQIRYIDFQNGDDQYDGKTPAKAWKHHPWDHQATANSKQAQNVDTYVFKCGVVYRGYLEAKQSGTSAHPIKLTSDPNWGTGDACLYASEIYQGKWEKLDNGVWVTTYRGQDRPYDLWDVTNDITRPLVVARTPNWKFDHPDDLRAGWWTWEKMQQIDHSHLGRTMVGTFPGDMPSISNDVSPQTIVWSDFPNMIGNPMPCRIKSYDAFSRQLTFLFPAFRRGPTNDCRFFLENALAFLDAPGEFFFDAKQHKLYVRLENDRDPNTATIEIAQRYNMIHIQHQKHIRISGLTFRHNASQNPFIASWSKNYRSQGCIELGNNALDVTISNCRFEYVRKAVTAKMDQEGMMIDQIRITDNDIFHASQGGITLSDGNTSRTNPDATLYRIHVLRNRLRYVGLGLRPLNNHGTGIDIRYAHLGEVAGNVIDQTGAQGINIRAGKNGSTSDDMRTIPMVRLLVHHNKVTNTLQTICDYGGIETWQLGPVYLYNNISGNPIGYRRKLDEQVHTGRYHENRFGFAYYLDGAFKNYVFNNIAWGKNNDLSSELCNSAALQAILGFNNAYFNNTFFRFGSGSRKQSGVFTQFTVSGRLPGRNFFLGNIWQDISDTVLHHDAWLPDKRDVINEPIDYTTMAYKQNVFSQIAGDFGTLEYGHETYPDLPSMSQALVKRKSFAPQIGTVSTIPVLRDAPGHDFRPAADAKLPKRIKHFVPWALQRVVGEWHFYQPAVDGPMVVFGENMNFTGEWMHRTMYRLVPTNDLQVRNASWSDFSQGTLENWVNGALSFNGLDVACQLSHQQMTVDGTYDYKVGGKEIAKQYAGKNRQTLDMTDNSFLIELVCRIDEQGGVLLSKQNQTAGYQLAVDPSGELRLTLKAQYQIYHVNTAEPLPQSTWMHVLIEVERGNRNRVRMYVDSVPVALVGHLDTLPIDATLANEGDFWVGCDGQASYFKGALDYLRIARTTLTDSLTSIDELSKWQFDGPFLRDFAGRRMQTQDGVCGALNQ